MHDDVALEEDGDGPSTQTPSSNAQALVSLQKCSPCGKSLCSFSPQVSQFRFKTTISDNVSSPQESPSRDTYSLVIGKPVSNCDDETNQTVTSKYTHEMEVMETWSVDSSIGVSFAGLSVMGGVGWSKSAGVKASQQVSFSIPPGKMVCTLLSFLNQNARLILLFSSGRINSQCHLQEDKREYGD